MSVLFPSLRAKQQRAMTSRFRLVWPGILALLLAGCVQLLGPRTLVISADDLQQRLATFFPVQRDVLNLIRVSVDVPELQMLPASNRMALLVHAAVQERAGLRDYRGSMAASFGLRFDPGASTVNMVDVKLDSVQIDGLPAGAQKAVTGLGALIAKDRLEGHVLYRIRAQDLSTGDRLGYTVGAVDVTAQGLAVRLIPKP